MKPSICLIAILLTALVAAGCSQPTPAPLPVIPTDTSTPLEPSPTTQVPTVQAPQDDSWQKVQQAGVLRVGTSANYPPFEFYNENSQLDGFDIALIKQIGQRLGLNVELNDFPFDDLPTTVAIGQVDVAIGAISVTPERQAIANFSNVYYAGSDAVLSRPEADPNSIQNPEALAAARLGVQVDTVYATYAQEKLFDTGLMPKQNLFIYTDISQAVNELKTKHIDAVWMDLKPAQSYVNAGGVKILVQGMNQQLYAIGMLKGADTLRDKINEALTELQNDGTLANLQVQYLGVTPEDAVTPQPPPTASPQLTPTPGGCLDGAEWVKDLSYDDHKHTAPPVLNPGQGFTKGWRMRNSGSCTWKSGYMMAFSYGNVSAAQMGGQPIPVTKNVKPSETYDFYVNLIAPVTPGNYQGYWNLRNAQNKKFGQTVWVDITVRSTATVTPKPTQTPGMNLSFEANTTSITAGDPVLFTWSTTNAKFVYFYHDGQKWSEEQVAENGKSTEYPPNSMNYYLQVYFLDNTIKEKSIWINVNPAPQDAPQIEYLSATPTDIVLGLCTSIDWSVTGKIDRVDLLVDDVVRLENTAIKGNYPDCPTSAGPHVYTLQASGPGGKDTQQVTVNVRGTPPTEPPVVPTDTPVVPVVPTDTAVPPEVPTETPEPTLPPEPETPVIQGFSATPSTIQQGECVIVAWTTGGGTTRLELSRDTVVIWSGTELNKSLQDCELPAGPAVVQYTLVAYNNAGKFIAQGATVQVNPAP
jgi:polar amino acid transport system substrate-binding protein